MADPVPEFGFAIVSGIVSSIVASIIFLLFLTTIRPRIQISDKIAKTHSSGRTVYAIKIINKTRVDIVNIKGEMRIIKPTIQHGGMIDVTTPVTLVRSELLTLPGFRRKDKRYRYAFRFLTFDNLEGIWGDAEKVYARFTVYAQHSITGFGRSTTHYYYYGSIESGHFVVGNTMEIRKEILICEP